MLSFPFFLLLSPFNLFHLSCTSDTLNVLHYRLGRTARAGAAGTGIVILAEFETFFLRKREIVALSVSPHPASSTTLATESEMMQQARRDIALAMSTVDDETKSQFYAASLGFYKVRFVFSFPLSFSPIIIELNTNVNVVENSHSSEILSVPPNEWFHK